MTHDPIPASGRPVDPDAVLAAGLLWSADLSTADLPAIMGRLRKVASDSMLWTPLRAGAPLPPERDAGDAHLPVWRPPTVPDATVERHLAEAWRALVAGQPGPVEVVRVEVDDVAEAEALLGLDGVTGGPISPVIRQDGLRFGWQWPLRIGVAGPQAEEWAAQINAHWHSPEQFAARVATPDAIEEYEILVVDAGLAESDPSAWDVAIGGWASATAVVLVGGAPPAAMLSRVRGMPRIIAALPASGVSWFGPVFEHLAHDHPLDAALHLVLPGSLVAGAGRVLDATAVGHWAVAVARSHPELADMLDLVRAVSFDQESRGSRAVLHWLGGRSATPGVYETHGEQAAMGGGGDDVESPGPPGSAAGGEPPTPTARRLIATVWDGGNECRLIAPPERDLTLELRIAVPERGDVFAGADFPTPEGEHPLVEVEIQVTSPVWPTTQTGTIQLPMSSNEPSTSVFLDFRTPASGSALRFDIVVLYQGRALQAATLTVPIRDRQVGHDRIRWLATTTTAGPEPTPNATPAQYSLNALSGELTRHDASVPLDDVQELLDLLERRASLTLGVDPAPASLADAEALKLLIYLARRGSELRDKFAPLEIGPQGTICVLVRADTPVLPLELVYEAEPPRRTAKLCRHVTDPEAVPPPEWGTPCTLASRTVVCPCAFWGMYRTIVREVVLPRGQSHSMTTLTLSPVLYAATGIADVGTPSGAPRPSDLLEQEARSVFGAAEVTRVTSWTAWRKGIRSHPELLLLLAHKEMSQGETGLFIGDGSFLASVDVRADIVTRPEPGAPLPLVLLVACASATAGNEFGTLPGAFAARGAAAVVGTLSKLPGPQGARVGAAILRSLRASAAAADTPGVTLGESLAKARRALVAEGLLIGLLLVSHGNIDLRMRG